MTTHLLLSNSDLWQAVNSKYIKFFHQNYIIRIILMLKSLTVHVNMPVYKSKFISEYIQRSKHNMKQFRSEIGSSQPCLQCYRHTTAILHRLHNMRLHIHSV